MAWKAKFLTPKSAAIICKRTSSEISPPTFFLAFSNISYIISLDKSGRAESISEIILSTSPILSALTLAEHIISFKNNYADINETRCSRHLPHFYIQPQPPVIGNLSKFLRNSELVRLEYQGSATCKSSAKRVAFRVQFFYAFFWTKMMKY